MENAKPDGRLLTPEYIAENLAIARELSGKSIKECSLMLGISSSRLKNFENGKISPSLPELESLSFLYKIPVLVICMNNGVSNFIQTPESDQVIKLLEIRQQIIATKVLIARENADISLSNLSKVTSIPTSRIKRYEEGRSPIPIDELNSILEALAQDTKDFFDHESPVGDWQNLQSNISAMETLPENIKEFCLNPQNIKFLEIAQAISKIGLENLYEFSNALSDFTQSIDNQGD
jgi:transcriptional regulator with XRE-family HTH domain